VVDSITEQEAARAALGDYNPDAIRYTNLDVILYSEPSFESGAQGNVVKFSFMTLSIAILMVDSFDISIHDISTGAAKLKHEAKLKNGNSFVVKKLA